MEILQQSAIKNFAIDVATLKDEIFVLGTQDQRSHDYAIYVYDRIDMAVEGCYPVTGGNPAKPRRLQRVKLRVYGAQEVHGYNFTHYQR